MIIRAQRDSRYYIRFLIIGTILAGFAVYCLYDGFVAYPKEHDRAVAYEQLIAELKEKKQLDTFSKEWAKLAEKNGWPTDEPHGEADIVGQYVMAAVTGLLAVMCFLFVWSSRGRWIEGRPEGLTASWGQTVNYDDIVSLNKRQWRSKGIAKVTYQDGAHERRFVIDDYKFEREPTDEILRRLEAAIGPEKITGGPPEEVEEISTRG